MFACARRALYHSPLPNAVREALEHQEESKVPQSVRLHSRAESEARHRPDDLDGVNPLLR